MIEKNKTDEYVYFGGDVFNRDNLYCCSAAVNTIDSRDAAITTTSNSIGNATTASLDYTSATKGENGINITWHDVDYVTQSKIAQLQEQIDALKSKPNTTTGLRSALRTLKYNREVE